MAYPVGGGWDAPMQNQPPAPAYPGVAPATQPYYGAPPGGYSAGAMAPTAPYPPAPSSYGIPPAGATAPAAPYPPAPPSYGAAPYAAVPPSYGMAPYAAAPPSGYTASNPPPAYQSMAQGSFVAPAHGGNAQHHHHGGMAPMPPGPALGAATAATASVAALQAARPIHAPLVGPQYCYSQPVTLVLVERPAQMGIGGDDFDILDSAGRPHFQLSAKVFSHHDKRALIDVQTRVPVVSMERRLVSLSGRWALYDGQGQRRIAEAKPVIMTLKPRIKVYLNDGDKEADFEARGNFLGKCFEVVYMGGPGGGGERVVATVKKESSYANTNSYIRNKLLDKQTYFLTVQPGVDVAFMVALATLIDEIIHDKKD